MARIKVLSADEIHDPSLRDMMKETNDEMFGVYGHCEELFKAFFVGFYQPAKFKGKLPFALKELVRLKIAELNECQR